MQSIREQDEDMVQNIGTSYGTAAATIGFESDLWRAADALRSNMDAAGYRHVVFGPIMIKYVSDAFSKECVIKDLNRIV